MNTLVSPSVDAHISKKIKLKKKIRNNIKTFPWRSQIIQVDYFSIFLI